jgi:hypothetical protein
MKLSSTWYALILIALALLLNGAKLGSANAQSESPPARNEQQRQPAGQPFEASHSAPAPATPKPPLTISIPAPQTSTSQTNPKTWEQRFDDHIWPPSWETFFPPVWSNWGLIIAASVAALVALKTLTAINRGNMVNLRVARATRIAAEAGKESADAARASADIQTKALFDLERPWVFVRITKFDGFSLTPPDDFNPIMTVAISWFAQNFGRTPAFVFDGTVRMKIIPEPIPDEPDYGGQSVPIAIVPLPQGVPQENVTIWPIDKDEHAKLRKDEVRLMFYGFIKYRDTFGKEHESRWCATLVIPKLRFMGAAESYWEFRGPPRYTLYT